MLNTRERLISVGLYPNKLPTIAKCVDLDNQASSYIEFKMRDLVTGKVLGYQDRYVNPQYQQIKSRTRKGSSVGWFREGATIKEPLILAEGEKDFLTARQNGRNVIGLQGVANLKKTVNILGNLGAEQLLILVDNDEAASKAIMGIEKRAICRDVRYVLQGYKDVNDAYKANKLLTPEIEKGVNLLEKLGEYKLNRTRVKRSYAPSTDYSSIDVRVVLEDLFPEYKVHGLEIRENGKPTSGYRYHRDNYVIDFSGKDRPQGNARSVAMKKFNDKKETREYLQKFLY